jgi:hypothetical protein
MTISEKLGFFSRLPQTSASVIHTNEQHTSAKGTPRRGVEKFVPPGPALQLKIHVLSSLVGLR